MDDNISVLSQEGSASESELVVEIAEKTQEFENVSESSGLTDEGELIDGNEDLPLIDQSTEDDHEHVNDSEITKSIVVFNDNPLVLDPCGSADESIESLEEVPSTDYDNSIYVEGEDETLSDEKNNVTSISQEDKLELEFQISRFEEQLSGIQSRLDEAFDSNNTLLSSLGSEMQTRADGSEFKQLRKDFDIFSKKLKRVVQAEDSVNAETLDATKVPPDVLEITYAKTLNDLYSAMLEIYGDSEACDMVENARDSVRQFSAGVDFFGFENETFIVRGLSEAIASKVVSVKQIHGTYVELFKMLFQHVPNYNSQDFRAFVENGSREYTIEKVVSHERYLDGILSDIEAFRDELSTITENISFMAELQNNHVEEIEGKGQELTDIREQMKSIAKAVNLHTKAISKLNKTLVAFRESSIVSSGVSEQAVESADLAKIEEMVVSRASKEEIMEISGEMDSFKSNVENMFASIQEQLKESLLSSRKIKGIEDELLDVVKELDQIQTAEKPQDIKITDVSIKGGCSALKTEPDEMFFVDKSGPVKPTDMPIEDVIICHLSVLGSATLKQLEKQIKNEGFPMEFEKLSLVMSYLEQEKLVSSSKKGRYTFYSVENPVNV